RREVSRRGAELVGANRSSSPSPSEGSVRFSWATGGTAGKSSREEASSLSSRSRQQANITDRPCQPGRRGVIQVAGRGARDFRAGRVGIGGRRGSDNPFNVSSR